MNDGCLLSAKIDTSGYGKETVIGFPSDIIDNARTYKIERRGFRIYDNGKGNPIPQEWLESGGVRIVTYPRHGWVLYDTMPK